MNYIVLTGLDGVCRYSCGRGLAGPQAGWPLLWFTKITPLMVSISYGGVLGVDRRWIRISEVCSPFRNRQATEPQSLTCIYGLPTFLYANIIVVKNRHPLSADICNPKASTVSPPHLLHIQLPPLLLSLRRFDKFKHHYAHYLSETKTRRGEIKR